METIYLVITGIVGLFLGSAIAYKVLTSKHKNLLSKSEDIIQQAKQQAQTHIDEAQKKRDQVLKELREQEKSKRNDLRNAESRLNKKETELEEKIEKIDQKRDDLENQLKSIESKKAEFQSKINEQQSELERIAALSKSEAQKELINKVEAEFSDDLVKYVKDLEEKAKQEANEKAKTIMVAAMQKYAAETASESTATIVQLPADDMKGRIIGREGRNINTFEHMTGVDVIVDDTPGTVIIAGFDLLRRYIAKVSLERLVTDGRIHPGRIEEVVSKVETEVEQLVKELGEKASYEVGVVGLPADMIRLLGKLKFKTSYGQNLLKQSVEIANLASIMAAEIGADVSLAKKAGLLHAIGRAVDHEVPGNFFQIGADICKKYGMSPKLISIIENMQEMKDQELAEGSIVEAAYLISCNRPGVDKTNLESFVKRMEELENIAKSFDGVVGAYAVHTGNEVRVIVDAEKIDDLKTIRLSHEIARKIEGDTQFHGMVKVTVLRERRIAAIAE